MARTYNDIYIETRRALRDANIEGYALEAKLIVAQAAGKTTAQLLRDLHLYVPDELYKSAREMTRRRLTGEPVAYVTGGWEFCGVPLVITPDVLIPRGDTELMADEAVRLFSGRTGTPRILDLCAGSGCIGCALAVRMPGAKVTLVDISPAALAVAGQNVAKNNLGTRVSCLSADATAKPPMYLGRFDLIVCNAPYIPTAELSALDPSVRKYEPYRALDGGADGLDVIRPVIALWSAVLRPGGTMMLEICEGQYPAVKALLEQAGYDSVRAVQDPGGTDRVVVARYTRNA